MSLIFQYLFLGLSTFKESIWLIYFTLNPSFKNQFYQQSFYLIDFYFKFSCEELEGDSWVRFDLDFDCFESNVSDKVIKNFIDERIFLNWV